MTKTLFDHIKAITETQQLDYWNTLSESEKKTWSTFMIHRFLSMNMNFTDVVNEIQRYNLLPEEVYRVYIDILPKGKQWLKYIKNKKKIEYPEWLINIVKEYYEISKCESLDYIELFFLNSSNKNELKKLCEAFAVEPKLIKKVFKNN